MQLSQNNEVFDLASTLFVQKWRSVNQAFIDDYFTKTWLQEHRFWYEGAAVLSPSTNNALESFNRIVKDEHTMRERIMIGPFRKILFDMVEQWSLSYVSGLKEVQKGPNITLNTWTMAYNWAKLNISIQNEHNDFETIFTIPTDKQNIENAIRNKNSWTDFNEFKSRNFAFVDVTFPLPCHKDNWLEGKCTCAFFMKNFNCMHVLGLALRMKLVCVPDAAKNLPLGQKRKRGRPALAKAALVIQ